MPDEVYTHAYKDILILARGCTQFEFTFAHFPKMRKVRLILNIFTDLNNYQTTLLYMTTDFRRTRPDPELRSEIWTTLQSSKEDKTNGKIKFVCVNVECLKSRNQAKRLKNKCEQIC